MFFPEPRLFYDNTTSETMKWSIRCAMILPMERAGEREIA